VTPGDSASHAGTAKGSLPLACPARGGDIPLIAFITKPEPICKSLSDPGEPLEPPGNVASSGSNQAH